MRLKIDGFAKIRHADILIDGITVICGQNNTGKSTIGKVLYSIFNSLYDIDVKIENSRNTEIINTCCRSAQNLPLPKNTGPARMTSTGLRRNTYYRSIGSELGTQITQFEEETLEKYQFREMTVLACEKCGFTFESKDIDEFVENTYEKVCLIREMESHKIAAELIERFFNQIFTGQYQCLKYPENTSKVSLEVKGKNIELEFQANKCVKYNTNISILHEAFFIDDPFVIDEVSSRDYIYLDMPSSSMRENLVSRLSDSDDDIMSGLFEAISAKEALLDIYKIFDKVVCGNVQYSDGRMGLKTEQYEEPVYLENLSAGLKSFMIIKLLLEKGVLKEKDVLILDEPEIHLHPEWQLVYAEIIVLLQKKFDLSIVVTTHSAHFLEAIEYYSKKYELESKCNYYLARMSEGLVEFDDVTNSVDRIYSQMITPSTLLDQLKYEMVTEDE